MTRQKSAVGVSGVTDDHSDVDLEVTNSSDFDISSHVIERLDANPNEKPNILTPAEITLELRNIGGIEEAEIDFTPGVSMLTGPNATNRTSVLTGLCGVLGAEEAAPPHSTLSTDADSGHVILTTPDKSYKREYDRDGKGGVYSDGDPFEQNSDLIDVFVALLGDNPAREVVAQGADSKELRDVLMRPVDTTAINRKISELKSKRGQVDERITTISDQYDRLPSLKDSRAELNNELEETQEEISTVESKIEEYDADQEEVKEAEQLLEELQDRRGQLRDTRERIEYHQTQVADYREEYDDLAAELEQSSAPEEELEEIETNISDLNLEKRDIENIIADLDSIISVNEGIIADTDTQSNRETSFINEAATEPDDPTSGLHPDTENIRCWTCGSEVTRGDISSELETLRELRREKRQEVKHIEEKIEEIKQEKKSVKKELDTHRSLESQLATIKEKIEYHESEINTHESEQTKLQDEIADIEQRVDETDHLGENELLESYQRLTELEYERGRLEQNINEVETKIQDLEELDEEREELEALRDQIEESLKNLRNRVDAIERAIVDSFNTHMENLLNLLNYNNIARAWLERKPSDTSTSPGEFELHVVREKEDGQVYEDSVETLSESEREIVGLTLALTGYLVHRAYEDVPFLILDSVEAIDSSRIAKMLEYLGNRTGFLICALLPEDAEVIEQDLSNTDRSNLEADRIPADTF